MKLTYFFILSLFAVGLVALEDDNDAKCERILIGISDLDPETIRELFAYKKESDGYWRKNDQRRGISYTLEPKEMIQYKFSWTVDKRPQGKDIPNDGSLVCELPTSWQLSLDASVTIVFPAIAHGQNQDLPLHAVSTFGGIYLAKSRFPTIEPDHLRIFWHLRQNDTPFLLAAEILAEYKFISHNIAIIERDVLDKTNDVQLVGLHVSNNEDILKGNQHWLISDADAHRSILNGIYETPISPHNTWLPWFKSAGPEWESKTPLEAYQDTVLAGTDNAFVFDLSSGKSLPEPILGQDRFQMIFDAIAPSVYAHMHGLEPLFAHLILKQPHDYKLLTFAISRGGEVELRAVTSINDPAQIGLPSAEKLGFGLITDLQ